MLAAELEYVVDAEVSVLLLLLLLPSLITTVVVDLSVGFWLDEPFKAFVIVILATIILRIDPIRAIVFWKAEKPFLMCFDGACSLSFFDDFWVSCYQSEQLTTPSLWKN